MNLKNSNCDDTQKLNLWWNSKTHIVIELKIQILTKLQNSNCEKLNNSKFDQTQMVTKLKNSNLDGTQKLKLGHNLKYDKSQFMRRRKVFIRVF